MSPLALIVDDEPGILTTLSGVLTDQGLDTVCTGSGNEALALYETRRPDVVFLDVWLPDRDGLETLQALCEMDPAATVVMMSGHGTTATAVKAIKMGAFDYLEKPLSYGQAVQAVNAALAHRQAMAGSPGSPEPGAAPTAAPMGPSPVSAADLGRRYAAAPQLSLLKTSSIPQRTILHSTVLYGLGLHSGGRTGLVLQPLPPNSGIHFLSLPNGEEMAAHVQAVGDTDYATTLIARGVQVRTVEHLLSALHAAGVTNLLVKVHGEVPVLDGSALEFCRTLEEIGFEDQEEPRQELVIDRRYEVSSDDKLLAVEPFDGFQVSYLMRYPAPIGEQYLEFTLASFATYTDEIAPARTFGFMRDLKMLNELGLGSGGRLDNFILVGDDNIINTRLRFTDEFVRHKILDIIGDLYLLGYPLRGKVTARLTGHRDNIALLRKIWEETRAPETG